MKKAVCQSPRKLNSNQLIFLYVHYRKEQLNSKQSTDSSNWLPKEYQENLSSFELNIIIYSWEFFAV